MRREEEQKNMRGEGQESRRTCNEKNKSTYYEKYRRHLTRRTGEPMTKIREQEI
jgi:hypothetical protein